MISVFLDLTVAFDSVCGSVLCRCLPLKDVPGKFISLIQYLYADNLSWARAYGHISPKFTKISGIRQSCPLSLFLFSYHWNGWNLTMLFMCTRTAFVDMWPRQSCFHIILFDSQYGHERVFGLFELLLLQSASPRSPLYRPVMCQPFSCFPRDVLPLTFWLGA